ncbi:hypothetical protein CC78DRAFT_594690 [Lojkania enalia]|uniref:Uncharacterized protein n=1 Tax=Lojkania enalia TaxID=147567 RepID=A0A9P4KCU3_9PLEO|nr:hypothetical protein CC78DRAFT_594690 [Didymosphaeria enalia]
MRYPLVKLLGLATLGSQLGVHARALSGQSNHVEDIAINKRAPVDFNHIDDNPLDKRTPVDFNHIDDNPLDKRVAAGGAPPPPPKPVPVPNKPTTPGKPASNRRPLAAKLARFREIFEVLSASDRSDIVKITKCRAKREVHLEDGLRETLDKRAGEDLTLDWDKWEEIFEAVDEELARTYTGTFKLYVFGGISGLSLGARGPGGKTGDADYVMERPPDSDPKPEHVDALKKAIEKVANRYKGKVDPKFMNDDVAESIEGSGFQYIAQNSHAEAFSGLRMTIMHAPWGMQLVMKMTKISDMRKWDSEYKEKDLQDAKAFLKETRTVLGGAKINREQLIHWGKERQLFEEDTKEVVAGSIKLIDPDLIEFEQDVKDWIADQGC